VYFLAEDKISLYRPLLEAIRIRVSRCHVELPSILLRTGFDFAQYKHRATSHRRDKGKDSSLCSVRITEPGVHSYPEGHLMSHVLSGFFYIALDEEPHGFCGLDANQRKFAQHEGRIADHTKCSGLLFGVVYPFGEISGQ